MIIPITIHTKYNNKIDQKETLRTVNNKNDSIGSWAVQGIKDKK